MSTRVALIAHDMKKDDIVALAGEYVDTLAQCRLVATGTTGSRIAAAHGLEVERKLSGPHGGDLQIGAELAEGRVDATNIATARMILDELRLRLARAASAGQ
jgi:methylglyoxal synthase